MLRIVVLATVVIALAAASAAPASAPVISGVKVQPSPFYDDEPFMTVKFKTSVPAPPGRLYFLQWETLAAGAANDDCDVLSNADPVGYKGGKNVTVTAKLVPDQIIGGGGAFCPGPSIIQIVLQPAKKNRHEADSASGAKPLTIYHMRVFRQP